MATGIWILGDQLGPHHPALLAQEQQLGREQAQRQCRLLLIESSSVLARRHDHRQKLVLVWSAMRHRAAELRAAGWTVDHLEAGSFAEALGSGSPAMASRCWR
jgi:deoxyribodipyrimidine photolyase-related protein